MAICPSIRTMEYAVTEVGKISESLEDYLKIIFQLERERRVARVKDIAARKGVRMASVTGALRRMSKEGLVNYGAREFVELTEEGADLARKVLQRNDFLCQFLTMTLGLDSDTVEKDACALEHHLSPETLSRLAAFYQFIETSGLNKNINQFIENGGNVPCKECPSLTTSSSPEMQQLVNLEPGAVGHVAWLDGDAPRRLQLVEKGILPRVKVTMDSRNNGTINVKIKGSIVNLTEEQASAIRIQQQPMA